MTLDAMSPHATDKGEASKPSSAQEELAAAMVAQAQARGLALTGPDGLLKQLTKSVLEAALNAEMTERSRSRCRRMRSSYWIIAQSFRAKDNLVADDGCPSRR
jgi:hypothetical protein